MEAPLIAELREILRAVTIVSPQQFVFAGRVVAVMPPPGQGALLAPPQNPLVGQLQQHLYQYCYCTKFDSSWDTEPPAAPDPAFMDTLSAANASQDHWDGGWQISGQMPSGQWLVQKDPLVRAVWPGEFLLLDAAGQGPRVGAAASVFFPRESRTLQPGFYFAFGETASDQQDDLIIVRFYWNLRAAGAAPLLGTLSGALNRFQVPYRYKCVSTPAYYRRRDAGILFLGKRFYRIVAELLVDIYPQVREHLDADTPLFTRRLAPGLAFAEDPGPSESFGMSRCRMLAEGLWAAYTQGAQTEPARLQAVLAQFEQAGVSLERPYLNPGARDRYPLPEELTTAYAPA